ncbi:sugar ABC transporter substrate-binding protein [Paraburkholderia unamae]|uniref:Monosaccharide ABC transporter substrate-binding protein (CUT2 family) n=1 Tax=Paraburkholderia unamae TaxID=219649 RepID=A0ABX5KQ16_9BURK|nr:sugar ABC transporter substrate-binding protein [Paraburkholderia unamae]PVX84460.1 monosaccharide ABC transporter substrate-binding protein (CUT2 family) [Paraburkholderia unamae]CAG9248138.1 Inositol transport system sugar-binding protein [Paraburkholderia unamae]
MNMTRFRVGRVCAAALAAVALCSGFAANTASAAERFVMVSHGSDSNVWWNTVKNGMRDASEDFGVPVDYRNPPTGDTGDMVRILEQASARNYAGVITTVPNLEMIQKGLAGVKAKHIPIITINGGPESGMKLGAILHVGQAEYEAGKAAGERAKAAGIHDFLCVNHGADIQALWDRCKGFADAIGADYKKSTMDSGEDPTVIESKVAAYLRSHPSTQAVLALGPDQAMGVLRGVNDAGKAGKLYIATFDLSPDILKAIQAGQIQFAIDQQPYLQGYLSVAAMAIAVRDKTTDPAHIVAALKDDKKVAARLAKYDLKPVYTGSTVSSGPSFVTRDNLAPVQKYAGSYR